MSLNIGYLPAAFTNTVAKNFFNFNARTSRFGFWHFILAYLILSIIVSVVTGMMGAVGVKLSMLFSLVMLLPTIGIGARRLHDIGKSGWWQLIPFYNLYLFAQPGDAAANAHGDVPPTQAV